jgi:hypothetical protein
MPCWELVDAFSRHPGTQQPLCPLQLFGSQQSSVGVSSRSRHFKLLYTCVDRGGISSNESTLQ